MKYLILTLLIATPLVSFSSNKVCEPLISSPSIQNENKLKAHFESLTSRQNIQTKIELESSETLKQVFYILQDKNSDRDSILKKALYKLLKDPYLEFQVPYFLWEKFLNDLNLENLSFSTLKEKTVELVLQRRQLYVDKNNLNPEYLAATPKEIPIRNFKLLNSIAITYPEKPIHSQELIKGIPLIDRTWPRQFDRPESHRPKAIIYDLADIPGTRVVMFNDIVFMNDVFYRASHFIEMEPRILSGNDIFGIRAGGHDLKGVDLLRYYREMKQLYYDHKKEDQDPEYQRRLSLEIEFFEKEIIPYIQKMGAENVVYIAGASDTGSDRVVSHELLHARYFLDSKFRAAIDQFYYNILKSEDRDLFYQTVKWVGYNPKDKVLMANEFQAHMLEKATLLLPNDMPEIHELARVRAIFEPQLLEFLKNKGIEL